MKRMTLKRMYLALTLLAGCAATDVSQYKSTPAKPASTHLPAAPASAPESGVFCGNLYAQSREHHDPVLFARAPAYCHEEVSRAITRTLLKSNAQLADHFEVSIATFYGNNVVEMQKTTSQNLAAQLDYLTDILEGKEAQQPQPTPTSLPSMETRCVEFKERYQHAAAQMETAVKQELDFIEKAVSGLGISYITAKRELLTTIHNLQMQAALHQCPQD